MKATNAVPQSHSGGMKSVITAKSIGWVAGARNEDSKVMGEKQTYASNSVTTFGPSSTPVRR